MGCASGDGVAGTTVAMWNDWLAHRGPYSDREIITANERAMIQLMNADTHNNIGNLLGSSVIQGLDALVNENQAGGGDGTTVPSDINGIMGP